MRLFLVAKQKGDQLEHETSYQILGPFRARLELRLAGHLLAGTRARGENIGRTEEIRDRGQGAIVERVERLLPFTSALVADGGGGAIEPNVEATANRLMRIVRPILAHLELAHRVQEWIVTLVAEIFGAQHFRVEAGRVFEETCASENRKTKSKPC